MNQIDYSNIRISQIATHSVGNKLRDEDLILSDNETIIEDESRNHLLSYFLNSAATGEFFSFTNLVDIEKNEVYSLVKLIFDDADNSFLPASQLLARLLYDVSTHPRIVRGELNVVLFTGAKIQGVDLDAIGIFKSESSLPFLKINRGIGFPVIVHENGFDLKGLDKGCLIFNNSSERGYLISLLGRSESALDAQYWKDDFLSIVPIADDYFLTEHFLKVTKKFVDEGLSGNKADQVYLLNQSVDYFNTNERFDRHEFEKEVLSEHGAVESFRQFEQAYAKDNNFETRSHFDVSTTAVKKLTRRFKGVIKLDRNFSIHIHGDLEMLERGTDPDGRNFYKLYFEEES